MPDTPPQRIWSDPSLPATLTIHPCDKPSAICVLVLPGGGYGHLAPHENIVIAERCNRAGFHAAALNYSLAPDHHHPQMIHDAQRATRMLRTHANQWGIDASKIAVIGFSAGGHLAATLAVHAKTFTCADDDLASTVSAQVDAAVLCYAVIDLIDPANAHVGSRQNLLGPDRDHDKKLADLLSPNRHVNDQTPPTFLWHTCDDHGVPVGNAFAFAQACRAHRVPCELHAYETGKHGLGLATDHPPVNTWFDLAASFLRRHLITA